MNIYVYIYMNLYTPRKKFTWNLRLFHPWYPGKSFSQSHHFQVRFVNLRGCICVKSSLPGYRPLSLQCGWCFYLTEGHCWCLLNCEPKNSPLGPRGIFQLNAKDTFFESVCKGSYFPCCPQKYSTTTRWKTTYYDSLLGPGLPRTEQE